MILEPTAEQRMIREEARRFLAAEASPAARRAAVEAGGSDARLWLAIGADLGWCGLAVPEERGGLGLGAAEIAIVMEETGRRLACVPLWSTLCLAAPLVGLAAAPAARDALLPEIAAGRAATVAWPRPGALDPLDGDAPAARTAGDGFVLDGAVAPVIDLAAADLVLVPARLDGAGHALFALEPSSGHRIVPIDGLDPTRPNGRLVLDGVAVPAAARVDADGLPPSIVAAATAIAGLGLAAEQAGAAQGALDLALAHVAERVQFGRTIASFQAIKHRCAALVVEIAEARSLVAAAAAAIDAGGDPAAAMPAVDAARVAAAEVQFRAAEEALQMHGGVGFTWEYDPHLYLRRAQASAALLGGADARLERIAAMLLDGGPTP